MAYFTHYSPVEDVPLRGKAFTPDWIPTPILATMTARGGKIEYNAKEWENFAMGERPPLPTQENLKDLQKYVKPERWALILSPPTGVRMHIGDKFSQGTIYFRFMRAGLGNVVRATFLSWFVEGVCG